MADDLDDPEPRPARAHAFDVNDLRVSCLPAVHEPWDDHCACGHHMSAASESAVLEAIADHLAWAQQAQIHA